MKNRREIYCWAGCHGPGVIRGIAPVKLGKNGPPLLPPHIERASWVLRLVSALALLKQFTAVLLVAQAHRLTN